MNVEWEIVMLLVLHVEQNAFLFFFLSKWFEDSGMTVIY